MLFIFRVDTIWVAYPLQVIFRPARRKITCNMVNQSMLVDHGTLRDADRSGCMHDLGQNYRRRATCRELYRRLLHAHHRFQIDGSKRL